MNVAPAIVSAGPTRRLYVSGLGALLLAACALPPAPPAPRVAAVDAPAPAMRPALRGDHVRQGRFEFNPNRHDHGPKTFLGQPIARRGPGEIDEALDRLARSPATARFVSTRLATWFVADVPPPALVARMSAAFERSDGDIAAVLTAMFACWAGVRSSTWRPSPSPISCPWPCAETRARPTWRSPPSGAAAASMRARARRSMRCTAARRSPRRGPKVSRCATKSSAPSPPRWTLPDATPCRRAASSAWRAAWPG